MRVRAAENYAYGDHSVAIGYNNEALAANSFTAGQRIRLSNTANRSFAWGCSNSGVTPLPPINSADAFVIQTGTVGIRDVNPAALLEINGNSSLDDYLNLTSTTAASPGNILTVKNSGFIGVGQLLPIHPLHFGNGAYVSVTGNFMNASSR